MNNFYQSFLNWYNGFSWLNIKQKGRKDKYNMTFVLNGKMAGLGNADFFQVVFDGHLNQKCNNKTRP